ncbi:MAG: branched-chain amino acid ABC transporter permease [Anaerolineaceae bacterium]|nr:branched-chain amino acid ABC transporter permease [Anaerolineaceae bacterium]MCB9100891.1 branched-chain amino acid ABC transporter permease [Anaerolineales bacterium]
MGGWKYPAFWLALGLVLIGGFVPVITGTNTWRETMFLILMAVSLASSLNIILGYTGYVSFGHIVFFGLGGYVGFYLIAVHGWSLWLAAPVGGLAAGILALLLGKAILHLRGAYFALATIGINEAVRTFVNNFDLFGGPVGLELNFLVYKDYGGPAAMQWSTYWAVFGLTLIIVVLSYGIKFSRFGLGLLAIREDEEAAMVMGVRTPSAKTWAYVLSAIVPGMLGVIFFFRNSSIAPPEAFRLHRSIEFIVMVMLGGQGTVLGPLVGATTYEALRSFLLTSPLFKDLQLAFAGLLLLLIVLFVPTGIVGWLRSRFRSLWRILE